MNLNLHATITLRSSLAHGAFDAGATVIPFRREPVLQRDDAGAPVLDPYAALTADPVQREQLRQYAQRLLRVVWQSKSDRAWSYAQLAERIAVTARMKATLGDFLMEMLQKMGAGESPIYFQDDAEFVASILAAADANTLLALLREQGERLLIVARMQAESAARFEGRTIKAAENGQMALLGAPAPDEKPVPEAFRTRAMPYIPMVPVYSGNAIRNGVIRRHAARFLLDRFGWKLDIDHFRALFVGGSLVRTGEKGFDIDQRRKLIDMMPLYGLLGGAFNTSSMVEGSTKCGKAWPIVREAIPVLPQVLRSQADMLAMQSVIGTESYSRREDAAMLAGSYIAGQATVGATDAHMGMMFEREVIVAGTRLWNQWHFYQATEHQLGAWISAWVKWAERPVLGGASQHGHGMADVDYRRNGEPFLAVTDGKIALAPEAQAAFDAYQRHLDARKEAISILLMAVEPGEPIPTGTVDAGNLQGDLLAQETD
ncbi:MAG: hypothetical protein IPK79_00285 [Vampirovibrionales bacterium]|nr:hypothetical protein [Vampirovibrionales bacterium]